MRHRSDEQCRWLDLQLQLTDALVPAHLAGRPEAQPEVEGLGAAVADVSGRRQACGAAATELGSDRVDGETAMAVT